MVNNEPLIGMKKTNYKKIHSYLNALFMILIYDTFSLSFKFVAIDAVFFSNMEEMPDPENNRKQRQR